MRLRIWLRLKLLVLSLCFVLLVAPEWPPFGEATYQVDAVVGPRRFDFLAWELAALEQKGRAWLSGDQAFLDASAQSNFVRSYLAVVGEGQELRRQIELVYTDPDVSNPGAASQNLQQVLAAEQARARTMQPLAEGIIQEQVAWVLKEEDFAVFQSAWPPVLMHMTPLPTLLVISPRDRIERIYAVPLDHTLSTPDFEEMETAVFDRLNLSALVVPIGGMGTLPAMILETSSVNWLVEVVAHEWAHHWLGLKPLGIRYAQDPQMRTINETVAAIVDVEIRDLVLARFYPEALPPPPAPPAPSAAAEAPAEAGQPFDARAALAETRVRVDELLAAGKVLEAEAYMEAQRQLLVSHGHNIRKLNQAYFAFYGAYAAQPGATGSDPTGPMLRAIRQNSPSLRAFMTTVAPVRSFEDLVRLHDRVVTSGPHPAP